MNRLCFPTAKVIALSLFFVAGCRPAAERRSMPARENDIRGGVPMSIQVLSPAFSDGEMIPLVYTGDGTDRSPPLAWSNVPENTQSLALICDDPDAPSPEPWVHWLIYDLSPHLTELLEGIEPDELPTVPAGAAQGRNSWTRGQTVGYRGPAPPPGHGLHHYHFRLYALDQPVRLAPGADVEALRQAMQGHVLATGELVGTYQR